eukprot:7387797-Heterocapsa_arctica.AAC.1
MLGSIFNDPPVCVGGPEFARDGTLVACWWLCREIEIGTATHQQMTFGPGAGCGCATFNLP